VNLKESMELAGENLLNVLNPDRDHVPDPGYCPAHNTGRWWDAMLRLENATGFAIPAHLEGAMLKNLHRFTGNPDALLLVPPDLGWRDPRLDLHSLREGLLALNALVRYRNSRWATQCGHRMLETVRRAFRPDGTWDLEELDYYRYVEPKDIHASGENDDLTASSGRFLEALVWFYQVSGDPLALELADRMARYHLAHSTTPDGHVSEDITDQANIGHNHSYLGTLRGLLLYGLLTRQHEYVDRIASTFKHGVPQVVKESGWASHDLGKRRFSDRLGNPTPEVACPGDAAQLALWLASNAGYGEYLDDAQRLVRARLLPSQITSIPEPSARCGDGRFAHNDGQRAVGAYGGCHSLPHGGKTSVIDVTAAVLHTLTDIYHHIVVRTDAGLSVNLHFDYEDDNVRIAVERAEEAVVRVTPKAHEDLLIHVPAWTPPESVCLAIDGRPVPSTMVGSFVYVPRNERLGQVELRYALPVRETTERTDMGTEYHFTWRGDEIIGIYPNDEYRPFYVTFPVP
jgi:hypothetical protein